MSKTSAIVRLKREETGAGAANLQERILNALNNGDEVVMLDASKVSDMDGAALQVLVAAKKSVLGRGQEIRIVDPSPYVSNVLALTKLDRDFGL